MLEFLAIVLGMVILLFFVATFLFKHDDEDDE